MNGTIIENGEPLLSLAEAGKSVQRIDGQRGAVSSATIFRWIRKGLDGVHLEHVRIGRRIATSREALDRFAARRAQVDSPEARPPASPKPRTHTDAGRQKAIADAHARNVARGLHRGAAQ